ncbi:MAG: YfiR/HmsC family protein, partial [Alphaproteobacteria bacterium]
MFQWVFFSRRWTCLALVTLVITLAGDGAGHADPRTNKIQAVFLFKFFDYITWPDGADKKTICTYGGNPFGVLLDKIAELQN